MSTQRSLVFILVDSSASMSDLLSNGESKIDFAKKTLKSQLPSLIDLDICEVALADFREGNDNIVHFVPLKDWLPIGFDKHRRTFKIVSEFCLNGWIDAIRQPSGKTPIAEAIKTIASIFKDYPEAKKRIFLLTDGMENCDGDCIAEIENAQNDGIDFTIDVLGIALSKEQSKSAMQIAFKSGGTCKNIPDTVKELAEDAVRLSFEHVKMSNFVMDFVDGNHNVTLDYFSSNRMLVGKDTIKQIKELYFDDKCKDELSNVALFYSEECKELKPVTVVFLDNGEDKRKNVLEAFCKALDVNNLTTKFVVFWTKEISDSISEELEEFAKINIKTKGIYDVYVKHYTKRKANSYKI